MIGLEFYNSATRANPTTLSFSVLAGDATQDKHPHSSRDPLPKRSIRQLCIPLMSATEAHSSSTKNFSLPPLEDMMKSREVVLGYLIDDEFMTKFFLNQARSKRLYDAATSASPFRRYVKAFLARHAAQEAGCPISILNVSMPRESGAKEEAIIAVFYRRGPTYADTYPPTARQMAKFKAQLFLDADADPKWHILK